MRPGTQHLRDRAGWCKHGTGGTTKFKAERPLPAFRKPFLIALTLCAGLLSGCMSSRLNSALQPTAADYAYASNDGVDLPDQVSVVPASFAGRSPSDGSYRLASRPLSDLGEAEAEIAYALPDSPRGEVDRLIAKYAAEYEVPERLVRRVVKRESNFNPRAKNRVYWGLMQIRHDTARGMGYKGNANGLLEAETNLKFAVKYLRGAYIVANGNEDLAVSYYSRGYYYDAKRKGLLDETGLGKDRKRSRV